MEENFYELHRRLVQEVINFCKENNIENADTLLFSVDYLQDSIKAGNWHPGTDSSLQLLDSNQKTILWSI